MSGQTTRLAVNTRPVNSPVSSTTILRAETPSTRRTPISLPRRSTVCNPRAKRPCQQLLLPAEKKCGQVSPKEAQDLARHSTPDFTFNVYGRSREGRLVEAVERVAQAVLPVERVPGEYRQAVRGGDRNRNPLLNNGMRSYFIGAIDSDLS